MADHRIVSPHEVRRFLANLAKVPPERLRFKPRLTRDYQQDLADLGQDEDSAKQIIYSLGLKDYSYGPEEEHEYRNQEIWVFGYDIAGVEAYIKVRINMNLPNQPPRCLILSFHESDETKEELEYPYREDS